MVSASGWPGFSTIPATSTNTFLAPTVQVTVVSGQRVHVVSNQSFGTTLAGGATGLDLYMCYRVSGSAANPTTYGGGVWNNQIAQNQRIIMGLSAVFTGLSGTYDVGLCGNPSGNANWNSLEWGYTSATVAQY